MGIMRRMHLRSPMGARVMSTARRLVVIGEFCGQRDRKVQLPSLEGALELSSGFRAAVPCEHMFAGRSGATAVCL
jgi:hypothetical protein